MFNRLLAMPSAWWRRFAQSRGGAKIAWGCLPLVVLMTCCIGGTAVGQSVGLIDTPPTRTPGAPAATATPRHAQGAPGPSATPRLARNTPTTAPAAAEPTATTAAPAIEPTATTAAPDAPAAAPTEAPAAAPAQGPAEPVGDDCPPGFPIKGNQGDEWIYHVPGGRSYSRTKPEQCFATEADARSAGYRAAQN